jgi:hypothetical protein
MSREIAIIGGDRGKGFNPGFQVRGGLRWIARVDGRDILFINGMRF